MDGSSDSSTSSKEIEDDEDFIDETADKRGVRKGRRQDCGLEVYFYIVFIGLWIGLGTDGVSLCIYIDADTGSGISKRSMAERRRGTIRN